MRSFAVILVGPKSEGNVGAVARAMGNFDLQHLIRVRGCRLGAEAFRRAAHARHILERSRRVGSLKEALADVDLAVGTTAVSSEKEEAFHRHSITSRELSAQLDQVDGRVGLCLGREDFGLSNEELACLDLLVRIPCDPTYPTLNLSHAAAILFYELQGPRGDRRQVTRRLASGFEKERLLQAFHEFLLTTGYPSHKLRRTEVMFRRLVGRALPTKWEFHALMGPLRRASKMVKRLAESPMRDPSS